LPFYWRELRKVSFDNEVKGAAHRRRPRATWRHAGRFTNLAPPWWADRKIGQRRLSARQSSIVYALRLSLVHTNKTLKWLSAKILKRLR